MKRLVLGLLALLLVVPAVAYAYTCNASGCTWQSGYTEPSTLTNNQPITDLAGCTASYVTSVDGGAAGATKTFTIPPSRPQGGGVIAFNKTDATMLPPHTYTVTETIACTSTAFGTGAATAPTALPMNAGVTVTVPPGVLNLQ